MNELSITISKHAKERFSERIMNQYGISDINVFIAGHEDFIQDSITKMVEYGKLIYRGAATNGNKNDDVKVILKDLWVVIVDAKTNNVITIYKIDLGLGDDFNKQFVETALEKLSEVEKEFIELSDKVTEQVEVYKKLISENEDIITDCRRSIKALTEQNESYLSVIQTSEAGLTVIDSKLRGIVGSLIGKKIF